MTRQTGRTTRMALAAIKLAETHDHVIVLVPNQQIGDFVSRVVFEHIRPEKTAEEAKELLRRISFSSSDYALRGISPDTPVLADHTWHENYAWVLEAARRVEETENCPQAFGKG